MKSNRSQREEVGTKEDLDLEIVIGDNLEIMTGTKRRKQEVISESGIVRSQVAVKSQMCCGCCRLEEENQIGAGLMLPFEREDMRIEREDAGTSR